MKTIVGLYKTVDEANKVKSQLTNEGYGSDRITVIDQTKENYSGYESGNPDHESVGGRIKHFFSSLSGSDDAAHSSYSSGVESGGALLAVTVPDEQAEDTADLLYRHGASEIEGGYGDEYYTGSNTAKTGAGAQDVAVLEGNTGRGTTRATNVSGEQVIPVVAEELQVGKRQVQRGGVRVYTHVVSEPVSESVSLHEERVVVDRHVVDRPATDADFATGEGVIELTATGEEAVVGKRSRVVEEILVGKEASDRTEQINDTVRHTEVEVEPTTVGSTTTSTRETTGVRGTTGTGNDRY